MSQTRDITASYSPGPRPVSSFGTTQGPTNVSRADVEAAFNLVEDGAILRSGMDPLVELLQDLGFDSLGLKGVVMVPLAESFGIFGHKVYRKTIPVWVVDSASTSRGRKKGRTTFLSTKDFVSWVKGRISLSTVEESPQRAQDSVPVGGAIPASLRGPAGSSVPGIPGIRIVPASSTRGQGSVRPGARSLAPVPSSHGLRAQSALGGRRVPLPSSGPRSIGPPPSYVSQLGDANLRNLDELTRREGEFQAVPLVNGVFDGDEYFRRLDALNEERQMRGLPAQENPTPSTYVR